jgi:hypothetical protein
VVRGRGPRGTEADEVALLAVAAVPEHVAAFLRFGVVCVCVFCVGVGGKGGC